MTPLLLAVMLAAATPADVRWVQVDSIAGLRALPDQRADFLEGFHATMRSGELATEVSGPGGWKPGAALVNRFRETEGAAPRDAWTLRVRVRLPTYLTGAYEPGYWQNYGNGTGQWVPGRPSGRADPRRRARRSMTLAVEVVDPRASLSPPPPVGSVLVFPLAVAEDGSAPANRHDFPWREAGRATALLALEELHRHDRAMDGDTRLVLAPALRSEPLPAER